MKAKRNLLADLEAVNDDIDLHFNVDYAFRSSSLIKAVAMPTRHTLRGQAKGPCKARQVCLRYCVGCTSQVGLVMLVTFVFVMSHILHVIEQLVPERLARNITAIPLHML